jgi:hypothetical protein
MRTTLVVIAMAATALVAFGASAPAQADGGKAASYTGCLAKGDGAGTFKLTNVGEAKAAYDLVGGKDLEGHVGHKVEVKGSLAGNQLSVTSMSHVAASCP